MIVAGGVGLAPLRPVVLDALADRDGVRPRRARRGRPHPGGVPVPRAARRVERQRPGLEVELTDRPAGPAWTGPVGFVTEPLAPARRRPGAHDRVPLRTRADDAVQRGRPARARASPASDIRVSLERNMKCGVGLCGHCQLGPLLVCRDGPVVDYARPEPCSPSGSCDEPTRPWPCGSSPPATAAS